MIISSSSTSSSSSSSSNMREKSEKSFSVEVTVKHESSMGSSDLGSSTVEGQNIVMMEEESNQNNVIEDRRIGDVLEELEEEEEEEEEEGEEEILEEGSGITIQAITGSDPGVNTGSDIAAVSKAVTGADIGDDDDDELMRKAFEETSDKDSDEEEEENGELELEGEEEGEGEGEGENVIADRRQGVQVVTRGIEIEEQDKEEEEEEEEESEEPGEEGDDVENANDEIASVGESMEVGNAEMKEDFEDGNVKAKEGSEDDSAPAIAALEMRYDCQRPVGSNLGQAPRSPRPTPGTAIRAVDRRRRHARRGRDRAFALGHRRRRLRSGAGAVRCGPGAAGPR